MSPILDAIAAIEAQDPKEQMSYREFAKKAGINRMTLQRRHQKKTPSRAEEGQ
jgi:DNA-binding transcriptional regulator YhcF (GntR family)